MQGQVREIRIRDLIVYGILPLPLIAGIWLVGCLVFLRIEGIPHHAVYIVAGVLTYLLTKRFAIGLVLWYKAFAPMDVRDACRFTPTCSTYMIMAINKYGLIIGVLKGTCRILRCRPPNGGEDYP